MTVITLSEIKRNWKAYIFVLQGSHFPNVPWKYSNVLQAKKGTNESFCRLRVRFYVPVGYCFRHFSYLYFWKSRVLDIVPFSIHVEHHLFHHRSDKFTLSRNGAVILAVICPVDMCWTSIQSKLLLAATNTTSLLSCIPGYFISFQTDGTDARSELFSWAI